MNLVGFYIEDCRLDVVDDKTTCTHVKTTSFHSALNGAHIHTHSQLNIHTHSFTIKHTYKLIPN